MKVKNLSLLQGKKVVIDGAVGDLEVKVNEPLNGLDSIGCLIIAHPHPMQGGTMDNKVVHTLARAGLASNYAALRFNFRGVGASGGDFDNGIGEVSDMLKVTEYATNSLHYQNIVLAGFSFGGAIAARVARDRSCKGLILVAPAVDRYAIGDVSNNLLVIHGDQDDVVPLPSVLSWGKSQKIPITVFPGAGHFFHGILLPLQNLVKHFLLGLK